MNSSALSDVTAENPRVNLSNRPTVQPARNHHESRNELNGETDVHSPGRNRKPGFKRVALAAFVVLTQRPLPGTS